MIEFGQRLGAVEEQEGQIGLAVSGAGESNTGLLDGVVGVAQTGRIGDLDRPTVEGGAYRYHVAGRPGGRVDDRAVVTGQGVQEPALAHVRPPRQRDRPAGNEA